MFRKIIVSSIVAAFTVASVEAADQIVRNAKIYTANINQEFVDAMAITNGKIVAIGTEEAVNQELENDTQIINARGRLVLPGFIDNHNHVFEALNESGGGCQLRFSRNLSQQRRRLRRCKRGFVAGDWILGAGHDFATVLDDTRTPLEILDEVFPDNPVVFLEQTSHSVLVNSLALAAANIDANTPNPQGGKIMRDEITGLINGVLVDNAGDIVSEIAANNLPNAFNLNFDGLLRGIRQLNRRGITTVGDGRLYWRRGWYEVWEAVRDDGLLTVRASLRPWVYPDIENDQEQLDFFASVFQNNTDNLLITNQVKMYSDGLIGNGTAKLGEPYAQTFFDDCPLGLNYIPQSKIQFWLDELDELGYGAHIHTIGDGGITETLNAIAAVRNSGSTQDYTLTHVELMKPSDVSRFVSLDVDADIQIGSGVLASNHSEEAELIGPRANSLLFYPLRELSDAGANVVLSSDWDVNPLNPLVAISESVVNSAEGLPNILAAIDAHTINAAQALGLESVTGSLELGKSADFVILSRDITRIKARKIRRARVRSAYLQGNRVF